MRNLYISKVFIKNFRNFETVDILTNQKQIVFGENETGKTNYLYALQLILDPNLSDYDRNLSLSDFNISIVNPEEINAEIIISVFISNFDNSQTILAQLSDAVVNVDGERYLKITYKYYPDESENGDINYNYIIFKGDDESKVFTSQDRKYLQLKVIKPLRDVESELRNSRTSPLIKLLQEYNISQEKLQIIAESMYTESQKLLDVDEIHDLIALIESRFVTVLGEKSAPKIEFSMSDIESNRIVFALRLLLAGRSLDEKSLGIKNVLYIILLLLQFQKDVVPTLICERDFVKYTDDDKSGVLIKSYSKTDETNYKLIEYSEYEKVELFFQEHQKIGRPEIIIAIEEPEAHLHPILQRLVFKDIIFNNNSSVLLTTHSPNIASISPLEYMVHILKKSNTISAIHTYKGLGLPTNEKADIERYLDVNRGEVYFGRGVILVEGIAEEYLVPQFADLLGMPLDVNGIVVANINSTNFLPYVAFLRKMGIPYVILTDGDFYYLKDDDTREYHCLKEKTDLRKFGYLGIENMKRTIEALGISIAENLSLDDFKNEIGKYGVFIGEYTFEVDIMLKSASEPPEANTQIINAYNAVCQGGKRQQDNFAENLKASSVFKCLNSIESKGIGKGRFAQRLSNECVKENIPQYIKNAIGYIAKIINPDE